MIISYWISDNKRWHWSNFYLEVQIESNHSGKDFQLIIRISNRFIIIDDQSDTIICQNKKNKFLAVGIFFLYLVTYGLSNIGSNFN